MIQAYKWTGDAKTVRAALAWLLRNPPESERAAAEGRELAVGANSALDRLGKRLRAQEGATCATCARGRESAPGGFIRCTDSRAGKVRVRSWYCANHPDRQRSSEP